MAKRPTNPKELSDALRDAVERTVETTLGSAGRSRDAAQDTVEDLRKGAEQRIARSRKAVAEAIDTRRPATYEDMRELKAELRAIGRRLDAIEERLPAPRKPAARKPAARKTAARKPPAKRGS